VINQINLHKEFDIINKTQQTTVMKSATYDVDKDIEKY